MESQNEKKLVQEAIHRLAELMGASDHEIQRESVPANLKVDGAFSIKGNRFLLEIKVGGLPAISEGAGNLKAISASFPNRIPLLVVPFMTPRGSLLMDQERLNWLDLSGNARIHAPGLAIFVEGKLNRFKHRGRPSSPFAPKSARITRWLLTHPNEFRKQGEIAKVVGLQRATASKVVQRLRELGLVSGRDDGTLSVPNPALLLGAWEEDYRFAKHRLIKGHIPARTGEETVRKLAESAGKTGLRYAATGLAAAWLLTRFANFRVTTLFLEKDPPSGWLENVGFREDERGSNVWLAIANDEGVFQGAEVREGVGCVHPVQAFLDLKEHPERAKEAAEELRKQYLNWMDGRGQQP